MSRRARIWSYVAVSVVMFLGVVLLIGLHVLRTPWFSNYVRGKIIAVAEDATGGRTEIGAFAFDWRHLQATVTGFTIHGTEPSGSAPLLYVQRVVLRLKLLASFKKAVDLSYLGIEQPAANVIVYPGGGTNVPQPKVVRKSNKSSLETVVDLAVGRLELTGGTATLANRSAGFSASGDNLRAQLFYRAAPAGYTGELSIGKLDYTPQSGEPLSASLNVPVEIGTDSIDIRGARLATAESQVTVTGSLAHMDAPVITAHATGRVSLAEVQRHVYGSMKPCAGGAPCFATVDVEGRMDDQSIRISNAKLDVGGSRLEASGALKDARGSGGLQVAASVAMDQIGKLLQVEGDPRGSLRLSGVVQFRSTVDYRLNGQFSATGLGITQGSTRLHDIGLSSQVAMDPHEIALTSMRLDAFGGEFEGRAKLENFAAFHLDGQLRNLSLREFEPASLGGGYAGAVSGAVAAEGDLKKSGTTGLRVEAHLTIAPGTGGIPVSGKIDAAYDGASAQVQLQPSWVVLPNSRLDLSGTLGSRITVGLTSANVNDFLPALAMASKNPPSAMPLTLRGGRLSLQAQVTGSLSNPQISGHLSTGPFAVQQRPFDRASLDFTANPAGANIANGVVAHKSLQAMVSGSIGLDRWKASEKSPVRVSLVLTNGEVQDVLALAGQSQIPATGRINSSAEINGTVGDPTGAARISASDGTAYQQDFDRLDAQAALSDGLIRLVSLDLTDKGAVIQANGTYTHPRDTLKTGRIAAHVTGHDLPLERLNAIEKQHPGVMGLVQLDGDVAGNLNRTGGASEFALTSATADLRVQNLRDPSRQYGNLTARASSSGASVDFSVNSDLAGSTIRVNGRTTLAKDYPTTADANVQNLSIESALALAGQNYPVTGKLGFSGRVSGTLHDPTGEGQVTLTAAKIQEEPIDSLQAAIRYTGQEVDVPSLRLSAPAGSLTLSASFTHPMNQFNSGRFQVHAAAPALNLGRVQLIQQKKPGLGGTLALDADAAGEIGAPGLHNAMGVLFSKLDADARLQQIALGGRSYGDVTFSAKTKGNVVSLEADSNFATSVIHGSGEARLTADYPLTAQLSLGNVRLSNVREFLGTESIRPETEALLEAQASISGAVTKPQDLKGSLRISKFEVSTSQRGSGNSTPALTLKNDGPIAAALNLSRVTIQSAKLTGPGTDIDISGGAAFTGNSPMSLMVKATTDLGLWQAVDKSVYSSGAIALNAAVTGKYSDPLVNGTLQFKNASIEMEGIPNGISNANGMIMLNGSGASVQNLTAQSGGGKITISGSLTRAGTSIRYALRANAEHVRTSTQGITVVNTAALTLSGTPQRGLLSGTVTVERVGIDTQSDIGASLMQAALPKGAAAEAGTFMGAIRLDVRVRTSASVQFQTTLAKTLEGTANLNLLGTLANPGLVGRIEMTEGDLIFLGNEYTVDRGVIAFYDPLSIKPVLDVGLETSVMNVEVTLTLKGPMDNLKLAYRSDPPLQFNEIVGLLATGTMPTSDPTLLMQEPAAPQQSIGEMGETALVGQVVAAPISSRLQRVFGVSQLRVDPSFNSGSALPSARITLQQQVSNNITFTYMQDVSLANSELIRVAWTFSPRFSAVATRDENGIFGVDFFYRRQFR